MGGHDAMKFVIFGLTLSSSWGNGHATVWRSLLRAMSDRGHSATFFEKEVPYYAGSRDEWPCPPGIRLRLYDSLREIGREAAAEMTHADVALWTSYCPDGAGAARRILDSGATIKAFYDLDTPLTLAAVRSGVAIDYLPPEGLGAFDLVLSFTGGRALTELQSRLGARRIAPLYGSFDPATHRPVPSCPEFAGALSYLGTYAADRQAALAELFIQPAVRLRHERFLLAGAQYPDTFPWQSNIFFVRHLSPSDHARFLCSSRATLNVTRVTMAEYGDCPSGRLFEAAACGVPILSDTWPGLDSFFTSGTEFLPVSSADDVMRALSMTDVELRNIAAAARERVFSDHTAEQRLNALEAACEQALAERSGSRLAA